MAPVAATQAQMTFPSRGGGSSSTRAPRTSLGPGFLTSIVYVTLPPGSVKNESEVFSIIRSVAAITSIAKLTGSETGSPPCCIPPLSRANISFGALPIVSGAGVKLSKPVPLIDGTTANRSGFVLLSTKKATAWLASSSGPGKSGRPILRCRSRPRLPRRLRRFQKRGASTQSMCLSNFSVSNFSRVQFPPRHPQLVPL